VTEELRTNGNGSRWKRDKTAKTVEEKVGV